MEEKALEILKILNNNHYEAYVVGGYVRDTLLNRKTNDIDICTSATPKEILQILFSSSQEEYVKEHCKIENIGRIKNGRY